MIAKSVLAEAPATCVGLVSSMRSAVSGAGVSMGREYRILSLISPECRESYSPAPPPCSLEEICVFENGSRLKHDLNRQVLANPGLVGHVLDRETAEVIVHLPALTVAWGELAIENLEGSVLDRSVIEPWRNVFERGTRPPFVGG